MLDELRAIVGERGLLTGSADTDAYCRDWRGLYHGRTPAVVRPGSAEEVAAVVRLCAQHRVALVPQGGNTSMVGGATPDESGAQVVLSLQLSFAVFPLVMFTADKSKMGALVAPRWLIVCAYGIAVIIALLNVKLLMDFVIGG